ncbi:ORF6N domain-containing protein [Pedobacter sp. AW31-3R]|uniref:ORF6N domain-containing protein n=1 Tax=Pedobacter sp. AW31-3R TaxID=3445781 RepID=UPI003F9F66AF
MTNMNGSIGEDKLITDEMIMNCIYVVRGQKVMIDVDLAGLYHIAPHQLVGEVMTNPGHFAEDLIFALNADDFNFLYKQNYALKRRLNGRTVRMAFTEKAIPMLASIIASDHIDKINCRVIRIFYHIRQILDHYPDISLE